MGLRRRKRAADGEENMARPKGERGGGQGISKEETVGQAKRKSKEKRFQRKKEKQRTGGKDLWAARKES